MLRLVWKVCYVMRLFVVAEVDTALHFYVSGIVTKKIKCRNCAFFSLLPYNRFLRTCTDISAIYMR